MSASDVFGSVASKKIRAEFVFTVHSKAMDESVPLAMGGKGAVGHRTMKGLLIGFHFRRDFRRMPCGTVGIQRALL